MSMSYNLGFAPLLAGDDPLHGFPLCNTPGGFIFLIDRPARALRPHLTAQPVEAIINPWLL